MAMAQSPSEINKELVKRQIRRARDVPARLLRCRVGGVRHHWVAVQPDWTPVQAGIAASAHQCSNCLTIKRADIERVYGVVIGKPRYQYPEGYRVKNDGERALSSNAVRVVMLEADHDFPEMVPLL